MDFCGSKPGFAALKMCMEAGIDRGMTRFHSDPLVEWKGPVSLLPVVAVDVLT